MTAGYEEILYTVDGPVATITLNRPDQLNALAPLNSAQIDVSEYRVFETATVVADPKNTIPSGDGVHSLGLYKYSLNGTLAVQST